MNQIEDLIQRLCPDGVPFVELGQVADTLPGLSGKKKADFLDGNARYISYKNAFQNLSTDLQAEEVVRISPGEKQNALRRGDVIITGSSESQEDVGLSSVVVVEPIERIYLNSFCFILRFHDDDLFEPGFSKYLFRADQIRRQIRKTASGVTRINVSKPRFLKVRVPAPPLVVQREIVRILDQFTQLEAELEARQSQFRHYREAAFRTVEAKREPLTSFGPIVRGRRFTKSDYCEDGLPALHYADLYTKLGVKAASAPGFINLNLSRGKPLPGSARSRLPFTTTRSHCEVRILIRATSPTFRGLKTSEIRSAVLSREERTRGFPLTRLAKS